MLSVVFVMACCNKDHDDTGQKQMTIIVEGTGIIINMLGSGTMTIDWGDGSVIETHTLSVLGGEYGYTYSESSTYTVIITGEKITNMSCRGYESQITGLDVSKNTALIYLRCAGVGISSLDVSKNTKLTELRCQYNKLTDLDVRKNKDLKILDCSDNELTVLDLSKNIALTELYCVYNQLTSLEVSNNIALTDLYCYHNVLTNLDLSKNNALKYLDCSNNQLTSLNLSRNNVLEKVYCRSNNLETEALNALFGSLCPNENPNSVNKSIGIQNNPGTGTCNINIATEKGWEFN